MAIVGALLAFMILGVLAYTTYRRNASRNLAAEFKLQAHIYEPAELHGLLSQPQRAALDGVKLGLE